MRQHAFCWQAPKAARKAACPVGSVAAHFSQGTHVFPFGASVTGTPGANAWCQRPVSDHLFVGGARQKGRLGVRSFISRYHHWARDSTTEVNVETNGGIT